MGLGREFCVPCQEINMGSCRWKKKKKLVKGLNYIPEHGLGKETMDDLSMDPTRVYLSQRYTLTTLNKDFR